jgi:hypothetical protein
LLQIRVVPVLRMLPGSKDLWTTLQHRLSCVDYPLLTDLTLIFSSSVPLFFFLLYYPCYLQLLGDVFKRYCNPNQLSKMSSDSEGSVNHEVTELDLFRERLFNKINEIEVAGSFATGGIVHDCPNRGICIDGGGSIRLPLSEAEDRALAHQSRQAPFGKNRQTLIDETVRKTWEIGAERITFRNPRWLEFVDMLVKRVANELGISPATDESFQRSCRALQEPSLRTRSHIQASQRMSEPKTLTDG